MFVILQFLIAVVIGLFYNALEPEPFLYHPLWTPVLSGAGFLLVAGTGSFLHRYLRRILLRGQISWDSFLVQYQRVVRGYEVFVLLYYAAAVFLLKWPVVLVDLGIDETFLVGKMGLFFPFLLALFLSWIYLYRMSLLIKQKTWTLREYLSFQGRFFLLPLFPLLLFLALSDLIKEYPPLYVYMESYPYLYWSAVLVFFFFLYLVSPFLLKVFWKVRSLPPSFLRRSLEEFSRKLKFHCRDILLWDTKSNILNAAIIGVSGSLRYVILSDALVSSLPEEEIRAVFAHEVGHAKKGHTLLYFAFSVGYIFLFYLLEQHIFLPLFNAFPGERAFSFGSIIFFFVLYWFFIFGYLSRRFEREADLYGARAVEDPFLFTTALENIARMSGHVRTLHSWRHFSVANRVEFLQRAFYFPQEGERFTRRILRLKILFLTLILVAVVVAARDLFDLYPLGKAQMAYYQEEYPQAEKILRDAVARGNRDPLYHFLLGIVLAAQGKYPEAIRSFEVAGNLGQGDEEYESRYTAALFSAAKRAWEENDRERAEQWVRMAEGKIRGGACRKEVHLRRDVYFLLGKILEATGRDKEGRRTIEEALGLKARGGTRDRERVLDLIVRADMHLYLGNEERAMQLYKSAQEEGGLDEAVKEKLELKIRFLEEKGQRIEK